MKKKWIPIVLTSIAAIVAIWFMLHIGRAMADSAAQDSGEGGKTSIYYPFQSGIIDTTTVISVSSGEHISPSKLFSDGTKRYFVYRISRYYCDSCNDYALFKISPKQVEESIPGTKCLIFADYPTGREVSILMKKVQGFGTVDFYMYNLDEKLPMEAAGMPYYFILDENMAVTEAFIANKGWNKECNNYLERLRKKFANK